MSADTKFWFLIAIFDPFTAHADRSVRGVSWLYLQNTDQGVTRTHISEVEWW
jgi:hypothetical protein